MIPAGTDRLPDWLIIGQERWDAIERRNQLLIRALADRHPSARFVFAERPLRPRELRAWRRPEPRQVAPNIWTVATVRPLPDGISRRLSDRLEVAQVRRAVRRLGLERPLLWTQDPRAADLVDTLGVSGVVYDLTDDWAAFEENPERRRDVRRRIVSLGRRADLVLACSRSLEADARGWSANVVRLPNAVDPPQPPRPVPAELDRLPRPRLGYAGTLHSSRLDVDLLTRAAMLRPDWTFVLIGPDLLADVDRARLGSAPNVHQLGVRPHRELRSYLEGFDVGLLPNLVNDFTRSLDPLKLYEYLAAGLPVVATPAGIATELAPYVALAETEPELVEQIQAAVDGDDPERARARRAAVAEATWDARAATVERALGVRPPAPRTAEVSVVIVSFNTRELLARCLSALRDQRGVEVQAIVVDNASNDGSRELVRERFPQVELVELADNAGFARANNVAFARCRGRYVLLLNSDAFLAPGALGELVAAAERHPRAGAVGPRLLNPDGTLQRSAWRFPHPARLLIEAFGLHRVLRRSRAYEDLGTWAHDAERPVDFLIGACLLLRADALAEVGGFDERFWIYGEEADLQRRLAARGWSAILTPAAEAVHVGSGSTIESSTRLRHFYAGQMNFVRKHGGRGASVAARVSLLIGALLRGRWQALWVALTLRAVP